MFDKKKFDQTTEKKSKEFLNENYGKKENLKPDEHNLIWGDVVVNLTENTIPRMSKAKSFYRKIFWLIVLFFGIGKGKVFKLFSVI